MVSIDVAFDLALAMSEGEKWVAVARWRKYVTLFTDDVIKEQAPSRERAAALRCCGVIDYCTKVAKKNIDY